jgi:hypothetical protein
VIHEAGVWLVTAAAVLLPLAFDPSSDVAFALPKAETLGILAYALAAALVLILLATGWRAIPMSWVHIPVGVYLATLVAASVRRPSERRRPRFRSRPETTPTWSSRPMDTCRQDGPTTRVRRSRARSSSTRLGSGGSYSPGST